MRRAGILVTCALGMLGCGAGETALRAEGTERAPAAKATVVVERESEHRDLDVQVHDLPAPEEVGAGFTRYGVWMTPAGGRARFLGFLRYQSDIRYGDLETRVPLTPVTVEVTAEHDRVGVAPSDVVILRRTVD